MKTIALANQKGGVGKTTTAASLGIGLSRQGKKVLLIDADAQGNLTQMLGWSQPDELSPTLSTLMEKIIAEQPIAPNEGILHHPSGVHLVPANIELSALEVTLVNTMSRETVLRQYLSTVADRYDYALIDCMPSLGMLTINALTAADSVIIPVQAQYLPAKGLEQLLRTITRVKRQLNPKLEVDGIVLTMVDSRTTLAREINALVRKTYGGHVFASEIPRSIKAAEISVENKSIYDHDRSGKAAQAYSDEAIDVLRDYNGEKLEENPELRAVTATLSAALGELVKSDTRMGVIYTWSWDSKPLVLFTDYAAMSWEGTYTNGKTNNMALDLRTSFSTVNYYYSNTNQKQLEFDFESDNLYHGAAISFPAEKYINTWYYWAKYGSIFVYTDLVDQSATGPRLYELNTHAEFAHYIVGLNAGVSFPAGISISFSGSKDIIGVKNLRLKP